MDVSPQQEVGSTSLSKSARPPSSQTNNSIFADSAISMGEQTPTLFDDAKSLESFSPQFSERTVADRLRQLSMDVRTLEQEGFLDNRKRRRLERAVEDIQAMLEADGIEDLQDDKEEAATVRTAGSDVDEFVPPPENELQRLQDNLAATISSMRLRQQEHRHLHRLSVQKIEAVANTCLVQQAQLKEMREDLTSLREENNVLGQQNLRLSDRVEELHLETAKREAAVTAMSSAVAGLEGWIDSSPQRDDAGAVLQTPKLSRRTVIRGRGRFRGKYYVEAADGTGVVDGLDGTSDVRELHDGVKAWLRGFRDVEEELHVAGAGHPLESEISRNDLGVGTEDWGEFENAIET